MRNAECENGVGGTEGRGWGVVQLEAPVARVCGLDMPFPLIYEPFYVPTADKVDPNIQTMAMRSIDG